MKNIRVLLVSGTPGTGKLKLAKELSLVLDYKYVDINKVIKAHNLGGSYDKEMQCEVVDAAKLTKQLERMIRHSTRDMIIGGHLSHFLPKEYVDLCIITKCDLKELKKRLENREYTDKKVRENIDCEIFDVCLEEAKEQNHEILIVDTTRRPVNEIVEQIKKKIGI